MTAPSVGRLQLVKEILGPIADRCPHTVHQIAVTYAPSHRCPCGIQWAQRPTHQGFAGGWYPDFIAMMGTP